MTSASFVSHTTEYDKTRISYLVAFVIAKNEYIFVGLFQKLKIN